MFGNMLVNIPIVDVRRTGLATGYTHCISVETTPFTSLEQLKDIVMEPSTRIDDYAYDKTKCSLVCGNKTVSMYIKDIPALVELPFRIVVNLPREAN